MKGYFVTGTDTGVGKTRVAVALTLSLRAQGLRVAVMKPVAAGAAPGALNDDVVALRAVSNVQAELHDINPYTFEPAIAPHLAAEQAGVSIELPVIARAFERLAAVADVVVVEGAGGWRVPLNDREDMADLAHMLGLPVMMVVGLRLGCLNHARLTAASIEECTRHWGWVANTLEPAQTAMAGNLESLRRLLGAPCLGVCPYQKNTSISDAPWLDLAALRAIHNY
ncbi:MAG: dethiobiotin synthase [Thiobacillus sp.]